MNAEQSRCERAYQRGQAGEYQVRTSRGRLVASGWAVEEVEGRLFGSRTLWRRVDGCWLAREVQP